MSFLRKLFFREKPDHRKVNHASRLNLDLGAEPPGKSGKKFPCTNLLDVRRFVLDKNDQKDWSFDRLAPFITEMMNEEAYDFFKKAFGYLYGSGVRGDYHEYGCFSARTFRMALSESYKWQMDDMRLYAFDSFQGLPKPEEGTELPSWVEGAMAMSVEEFKDLVGELGFGLDRVEINPGFYREILNQRLQQELLGSGRNIAFCNVDCDLRESAEDVFRFIEPLVRDGTLIYLDDWFVGYGGRIGHGVAGAYREFLGRAGWKSEEFASVGFWGKSFIIYK